MRVIVGLKRLEETFRLLWLSESRSGIYIGHFAGAADVHFSYHQDGTRHTRIAKGHHQRWKDAPLSSHTGFKLLLHGGIPLNAGHERWSKATSARDQLITFDSSQFAGYDTLAVDALLSDLSHETSFSLYKEHAHSEHGFLYISHSVWRLSFFPNLFFALYFWAANTHASVER